MSRFQKTAVQWPAAGLFLIGLYALAGLAYAAFVHGGDSATAWAVIAAIAFIASFAWHRFVTLRRRDGA
jgi:hypothetical protein